MNKKDKIRAMGKDPDLIKFGKELRKLRIDKDFSRRELASLTGLSQSYIGGMERGERNASIKTISKMLRTLGEKEMTIYLVV